MYIQDKNLYISEKSQILFDLNAYRIFYITDGIQQYFQKGGNEQKKRKKLNDNELDVLERILTSNTNELSANIMYNSVKIHVSNACNLKCKYCYANGGNYGAQDSLMDKETADKIIRFINTSEELQNIKYITFFGGEPLLNPDIIEYICERTQERNVGYLLQTNGTIVNENIIRILKKFNVILTISLDGPEQVNDFNRIYKNGGGTYKRILGNIQLLRENGIIPKAVEATLSACFVGIYGKEEIADFIYESTGIQYIKVEYDMDLEISVNTNEEIEKEVRVFFDRIIRGKYIIDNCAFKIICTFLSKSYNDFVCSAGNKILTVDAQGHIFPCQLFLEDNLWQIGDIVNGFSKNLLPFYQKSKREQCQSCSARTTCSGCIAKGIKEKECKINRLCQEIVLEAFAVCIKAGQFEKLYSEISSL